MLAADHPLRRFTEADGPAWQAEPFAFEGRWYATDGTALAFTAGAPADAPAPAAHVPVARIVGHARSVEGAAWMPLPEADRAWLLEVIREAAYPCEDCDSKGRIAKQACVTCSGAGRCWHCRASCEDCEGEGFHQVGTDDVTAPTCVACGGHGCVAIGIIRVCGVFLGAGRLRPILTLPGAMEVAAIGEQGNRLAFRTADLAGFVMPVSGTDWTCLARWPEEAPGAPS